jgi:uncharacterized protein
MNEYGDHGVLTFTLLGGMKTQVLFFSTCHPAISRKLVSVYENKHIPVYAKVLDIEPILARRELVYGLQTTTGNYIAHGHTSKNCFAHCFDADYEKSHLSMDMAQKAVDWLMDPGTRGDARKVDITFWGGEPLLRWAVLQETVLYAERKAQEYGIEVTFGGTTNVTLLTPEKFDFLEIHNIHFLLSCDGIQTHHDKFRRHADGRGSWEQVDRNLTDIIARWPMSEIRLSFTAENLEGFIEDMDYFFTKGFRAIVYSPVSEGDWTEERLAKLHEAWADTARWFVEHWQQDERLSIKFIKDACTQLNGQPVGDAAPCGAGRGYCGIAVDGSIWNCHRFHKMDDERPWYEKETCLGHIEIGILNQEWRKPFMEWIPFRDCSDGCHDCRAFRVSCTGGCWATNWDLNGDISYPPRVNCETSLAALEQADIVTEMLGKKYLDTILPHQHATSALPEVQGCQCFNVQDNLYGRYRMNKTEPYACLCNMSTYGTAPKPIRSCTCYNVENQGRGLFDPSGTNCSQYTSPAVLDDARTYLSTLQEHLDELDPATLDHVESFLDSLGGFRT